MSAVAVEPRPPPRRRDTRLLNHQRAFLGRRPMPTIRRAAAVLIYPAIICMGAACERADPPTSSPPTRAPRADLTAATPNTDWLVRALSLGVILSDDPTATPWTDELEDDPPDNDPIHVDPFQFDPSHTDLVRARWL